MMVESAEKSPLFIAAVGTVPTFVIAWRMRVLSKFPKKKVLFFLMGPPNEAPY